MLVARSASRGPAFSHRANETRLGFLPSVLSSLPPAPQSEIHERKTGTLSAATEDSDCHAVCLAAGCSLPPPPIRIPTSCCSFLNSSQQTEPCSRVDFLLPSSSRPTATARSETIPSGSRPPLVRSSLDRPPRRHRPHLLRPPSAHRLTRLSRSDESPPTARIARTSRAYEGDREGLDATRGGQAVAGRDGPCACTNHRLGRDSDDDDDEKRR